MDTTQAEKKFEYPMIWRVGCKLQHTWALRSSWTPEGSHHRMQKYECNFCPEEMVVQDVQQIKQKTHPLCELGVHEWDYHCCCWNDPDAFCARFCGAIRKPDGKVIWDPHAHHTCGIDCQRGVIASSRGAEFNPDEPIDYKKDVEVVCILPMSVEDALELSGARKLSSEEIKALEAGDTGPWAKQGLPKGHPEK